MMRYDGIRRYKLSNQTNNRHDEFPNAMKAPAANFHSTFLAMTKGNVRHEKTRCFFLNQQAMSCDRLMNNYRYLFGKHFSAPCHRSVYLFWVIGVEFFCCCCLSFPFDCILHVYHFVFVSFTSILLPATIIIARVYDIQQAKRKLLIYSTVHIKLIPFCIK